MVTIQEKKDRGGWCNPGELGLGDGGSEQCHDAGDSCLGKSHCGPGAFDNHDPAASFGKSTVSVIKQLALWETGWEAPLAPVGDGVRFEAPAAVAERTPLEVVETDGNSSPEESASGIRFSGLEACGGFHLDALVVLEEGHPGIERDAAPEWPKGDGGGFAARV